jgi:hypothetical protein
MRRRVTAGTLLVLLVAIVYVGFLDVPSANRDAPSFQPDRTADLELDMWRAYYDKRNVALFGDLIVMCRENYRLPWAAAVRMAFHLARAAATFGNLRSDYDQVLPDLERAYGIARDWSAAAYDPAAVARAELAWWVARRVPGQDSPEHVGALIADLNALLYAVPHDLVLEASVLRARAGKLRDLSGADADWADVGRLLRASYRLLHAAVSAGPPNG